MGVREKKDWKNEEKKTDEEKKWGKKKEAEGDRTRPKEAGRKNGIVISGIKWRMVDLERAVEEMIEKKIKIKVRVKTAKGITFKNGEQEVVAEINSWEEKREIMKRKKELEDWVFIDDDLTWEEREVQRRLRRIAIEEREKNGEYVKVGYDRIFLGGK